jgi:hypothetical protein
MRLLESNYKLIILSFLLSLGTCNFFSHKDWTVYPPLSQSESVSTKSALDKLTSVEAREEEIGKAGRR